jgi:hypothetical protein
MLKWLLLHYKIPPDPSARRVYIWRKLKRSGALFFQDAVWILPSNPRTEEQLRWLAAEILEMDGEASLWEAELAFPHQDESLVTRFNEQEDRGYQPIQDALQMPEADLEGLSRQYQQSKVKDYFNSELGKRVKETLLASRGVEA